jgi:hypothetical protein
MHSSIGGTSGLNPQADRQRFREHVEPRVTHAQSGNEVSLALGRSFGEKKLLTNAYTKE